MEVKCLELRDDGITRRPYRYTMTHEGKLCARCSRVLPPTREFWHHRSTGAFITPCKRCVAVKDSTPERRAKRSAAKKKYRAALSPEIKKEIQRESDLRKLYGITIAEYEAIFAAQGSACAICKTKNERHGRFWHVDHCHSTKIVRGILCAACNVMLGHSKENPEILQSAISYLEGRPWK